MTCNKFEEQVRSVIQGDSITVGERRGNVGQGLDKVLERTSVCFCVSAWDSKAVTRKTFVFWLVLSCNLVEI